MKKKSFVVAIVPCSRVFTASALASRHVGVSFMPVGMELVCAFWRGRRETYSTWMNREEGKGSTAK